MNQHNKKELRFKYKPYRTDYSDEELQETKEKTNQVIDYVIKNVIMDEAADKTNK